ncbi:MAG: MgtC/SapB family protein [Chloroflexi bacterium]|nr:MgtC/SapB family protein [Chloroflexota bacterium]
MEFYIEDLIKILLSIAGGGLIGLEREFRDKSAGFRTLIFISAGATLYTILSERLAGDNDPTRIAANIVTGIGFLGAGAILREGFRITGLTTAAAIWLTAAVGMAIGVGEYLTAGIVVAAAMVVLWIFPFFEFAIDRIREETTYEVVYPMGLEKIETVEQEIRRIGLFIRNGQHIKQGNGMRCTWALSGSPRKHEKFLRYLFEDKEVVEFSY